MDGANSNTQVRLVFNSLIPYSSSRNVYLKPITLSRNTEL